MIFFVITLFCIIVCLLGLVIIEAVCVRNLLVWHVLQDEIEWKPSIVAESLPFHLS